jgi:ElaB/YqjD/DUF883 family membrane-anchored ribosome-binding protein
VGEPAREVVEEVQTRMGEVGNRIQEGWTTASRSAEQGYRRAEGLVERNPSQSILVGFGVGFGIGLALTALLASREETWAEKYLPESLQDLPNRYQHLVSSLKDLPRTAREHLPTSVARHLG